MFILIFVAFLDVLFILLVFTQYLMHVGGAEVVHAWAGDHVFANGVPADASLALLALQRMANEHNLPLSSVRSKLATWKDDKRVSSKN